MIHRLARAALASFFVAAPWAPGRAQEAVSPAAPDELVRGAAEKLATQGLKLDLTRLGVAVRPLAECEAAELARLKLEFGSERAEAFRLLLQGEGLRFENGDALLAEWARLRMRQRAACYRPESRELVVVAERAAEVGEHELLAALALAGRHQGGAPVFEAPAQETLDGWLVRQALCLGGAEAEAQRALPSKAVDRGPDGQGPHGREIDLPRLDREASRRGLESFAGSRAPEALAGEWAVAPVSSEQLLHRVKRDQDAPADVALPPWPEDLAGAQLAHEDTLGELGILALLIELGTTQPRAEAAATGWDGDRLRHYRTDGEDVLVWRTLWDRPKDAQQFADEWSLRAKGEVRRGGRSVDWVLADAIGTWNKVGKSLAAAPQRAARNEADEQTTAQVEQEAEENRRSESYVVANEWRHPRLDLTVVVPIGWYEDERDGVKFIVRTKTAGYRDNVQVVAGPPDGKTIDEILAVNQESMRNGSEYELMSSEKRMLGGVEVGFLRYLSRQGSHEIIFSTLVVLRGWRQVAITVGAESSRWNELEEIADQILANVRLEPVEPMH